MGSGEFAKAWIFYSEKEENTNMTEKRVLTGYSKDVQADFERLKKDSTYPLLAITGGLETLDILNKLIVTTNSNKDKQILQDIADYINGKAKFPEQKYYIKMPKVRYSYLFKDVDGTLDWGNDFGVLARKYFTEDEIKDIDPRYMAFAVPVEADDE